MGRNSLILIALGLGIIALQTRSAMGSVMDDDEFLKWDAKIKRFARMHGVPWRLFKAIMIVESDLGKDAGVGFDKKSIGPMQVRPETADWMLKRPDGKTTMEELKDWDFNMDVAGRYLAYLGRYFRAQDYGWAAVKEKVIKGYNGGPGYANYKNVITQAKVTAMVNAYYAKVSLAMGRVVARQPGPEMEIA